MTRKHYNLIADVIKQANRDGVLSNVAAILLADRFAKALVGTNDIFDKSRFYNAATEHISKEVLFETTSVPSCLSNEEYQVMSARVLTALRSYLKP